jgi:hypothetical protein
MLRSKYCIGCCEARVSLAADMKQQQRSCYSSGSLIVMLVLLAVTALLQ